MSTNRSQTPLIERLPTIRGRYSENAPLHRITWFKVGGPAEVMFRPVDADDLATFLANRPDDVPITVIGVGSNLLVRDGGVPGVVVRLGRSFAEIATDGADVFAGASALDANVAMAARDGGIGGLEFLSGVPGTIGGALRMNAGAYETEMKDIVVDAVALDCAGERHELDRDALGFGYRKCKIADDWIFIAAHLRGHAGDPADIALRMRDIQTARELSQPLHTPTGGSTFANPPGEKAWQLIDRAGCRGLRIGGAQVSEKHCNFMVNTGNATAADLENLGEEVRARVHQNSGIELQWEIRRIGVAASGEVQ